MFTDKDGQGVFSLCGTSGQGNFIQSLWLLPSKSGFCEWKTALVYWNPISHSLCRGRSKLKFVLLCNEDIIKMWGPKREGGHYKHCNRCSVYSADCIIPCKAKLWPCHCYLQQTLLTSLGKWYLQVYYIYQQHSAKTGCWPEKAPHSVKDKIVLSVTIKGFDENNLQCKSAKGLWQSIHVVCYRRKRTQWKWNSNRKKIRKAAVPLWNWWVRVERNRALSKKGQKIIIQFRQSYNRFKLPKLY